MSLDNVHFESLTTISKHIEAMEISPVELTKAILKRIEAFDGDFKSYTTVTTDLALAQARKAEAEITNGVYRGPLHGVPVAVKDLCFTKGIRTTGGMTIYADFLPDHDATIVTRLAQAGAVLLGKLHMTEGATLEHHPALPEPVNPWRKDLWTGVSSSGSGVAPAAGMAYATIGSDTGGSIRFPSACNALTGVKPTWGRVSRYGIFDLAPTFDHLGPMARSAADAAAMLHCLAGWDPNDPTSLSLPVPNYLAELDGISGARGVKLGLDCDYAGKDADPETLAFVQQAAKILIELGAVASDVTSMNCSSTRCRSAWWSSPQCMRRPILLRPTNTGAGSRTASTPDTPVPASVLARRLSSGSSSGAQWLVSSPMSKYSSCRSSEWGRPPGRRCARRLPRTSISSAGSPRLSMQLERRRSHFLAGSLPMVGLSRFSSQARTVRRLGCSASRTLISRRLIGTRAGR